MLEIIGTQVGEYRDSTTPGSSIIIRRIGHSGLGIVPEQLDRPDFYTQETLALAEVVGLAMGRAGLRVKHESLAKELVRMQGTHYLARIDNEWAAYGFVEEQAGGNALIRLEAGNADLGNIRCRRAGAAIIDCMLADNPDAETFILLSRPDGEETRPADYPPTLGLLPVDFTAAFGRAPALARGTPDEIKAALRQNYQIPEVA